MVWSRSRAAGGDFAWGLYPGRYYRARGGGGPAVKLSEEDSLKVMALDSTVTKQRKRRDWSTWKPDPKRALWLSLIIPGAGQIYNRKYWKLPIVYGGFVGCAYALTWNNQMYHDYSQAYMDIMDNDPTTQSYNQFLHLG